MTNKTCGCCEGTRILTPMNRANRPGLSQLHYRAGIHATFLETMRARLSNLCLGDETECRDGDGLYPLQKLTTRDPNDPAIAFLDAWATVADVLTFYQERIANEGYLLTATERRSILELARLVGYKLRPGVAASTFLAFTLEDGHEVEIPAGTRAQSIPGPGELPQPFETSEPLYARDVWNTIQPRLSQLQVLSGTTNAVYLRGLSVDLKQNDAVLVVDASIPNRLETHFRRVHAIEARTEQELTRVFLKGALDLRQLEAQWRVTPTVPSMPDDASESIKTLHKSMNSLASPADELEQLLSKLKNPRNSAAFLRVEIELMISRFEQLKAVLDSFRGITDLRWIERLSDWIEREVIDQNENTTITGTNETLRGIINQLGLRRSAISKPSRLFEGQFIDQSVVPEIIMFLNDDILRPPKDISFVKDSIDEAVKGPIDSLVEAQLQKVDLDIRNLLRTLRDDTLTEDDRILAIKKQQEQLFLLSILFTNFQKDGLGKVDDPETEIIELGFAGLDGSPRRWILGNPEIWPEDFPYSDYCYEYYYYLADEECQKEAKGLADFLYIAITSEQRTTTLSRLVEPLLKPPSRPPANALRLERTIAGTFEEGADAAPRTLTAFQSELKDTLYQAWANTKASPFSPNQSFEVFRKKAVPFGAKFSPEPVYDPDTGEITEHKEWPLLEIGGEITETTETSDGRFYGEITVTIDFRWETLLIKNNELTLNVTYSSPASYQSTETIINGVPVSIRGYVVLDNETNRRYVTSVQIMLWGGSVFSLYPSSQSRAFASARIPYSGRSILTLDAEYDQIVAGSWVAIEWLDEIHEKRIGSSGQNPQTLQVISVETLSKPNYGKVTQLTLSEPWLPYTASSFSLFKEFVVYVQSEPLELAEEPIGVDINGDTIGLNGLYDGLETGRWFILSGERTDIPNTTGIRATELVMLSGIRHTIQQVEVAGELIDLRGDRVHTTIQLTDPLSYSYKRDSISIHGNVTKATHGETRLETLGSGDGNATRQSFTLKQKPLTHIAATTPSGTQSTLEVRVNDLLWQESDNLLWIDSNERGYITSTDNDDNTQITFGDGRYGTRLPTGIENIKAVYRNGIGAIGNVSANQISLLATKPLGVKEVINPLAATGGANRERRDQARRNAPLAVVALDRLVSLQDYTDFIRNFAGIDKASAILLTDGRQQLIHISIAGVNNIPIDQSSDLYQSLEQALNQFGTLPLAIKIDQRELILLVLSARIRLLPEYQWETVAPQIRAKLLDKFSFERRELGQSVRRSEIISFIQQIPGVSYVDIEKLDGITEHTPLRELELLGNEFELKEHITVRMARMQTHHVVERKIETFSSIAARYGVDELDLWDLNQDAGNIETLEIGTNLTIPPRIRPAQIAYLSPDVPDTLILTEIT